MRSQEQKDEAQRRMREKNLAPSAIVELPKTKHEKHYRVKEIAEDWGMSTDTVQELFLAAYFRNEPGIIATTGTKGRYKSVRHTLSISESARDRMYKSLQHHKAS